MDDRVCITLPMGKKPNYKSSSYFGRATLGSKFNHFLIPLEEMIVMGVGKSKISRDQPYLSPEGKKILNTLRKYAKMDKRMEHPEMKDDEVFVINGKHPETWDKPPVFMEYL